MYQNRDIDPEIQTSLKNLANQESIHGEWTLPKEEENVMLESDPICSSAGCTQYKHPHKELGYDLDYPVPNFGVDRDIKTNFNSLEIAQKIHNHTWEFHFADPPPANPAKKTMYNFAPALDEDIVVSQNNLKTAETTLNHEYDVLNVQLNSDPICSSAGCWKSDYTKKEEDKIIQYPDPAAQGLDSDIKHTLKHEENASASIGHEWNPLAKK